MQIAQKLTDELYVAVAGAECYRLHPALDSGSGRHVGRLGRGAGPRGARHGLPAGKRRTADGLAAQKPLRRLGHHAVRRRGAPAAAAHRQTAGAGRGRGPRNVVRRADHPAWAAPTSTISRASASSTRPTCRPRPTTASTGVRWTATMSPRHRAKASPWRRSSRWRTPWAWSTSRSSTSTVPYRSPSPPRHGPRRRPSCRRSPRTAAAVLPDDIGTAWSGTSYQEANASKTGGLVYALALVFVFLALAALYESWGLPLAILMSVPGGGAGRRAVRRRHAPDELRSTSTTSTCRFRSSC